MARFLIKPQAQRTPSDLPDPDFGSRRRVGEELLKDTKKTVGVVERSKRSGTIGDRRVLHNGGDAGLEERKVHEADAAKVRFLLVLGDNLGQSSNNIVRSGSKSHNTLVFRGDGKVVQSEASKMATVSALLGQALGKRRKDIPLSTADHGHTVLLVSNITKFVNALGGGGTLFSLLVQHGIDELRNVIKSRGLGRGSLGGSLVERKQIESCEKYMCYIDKYDSTHLLLLSFHSVISFFASEHHDHVAFRVTERYSGVIDPVKNIN